MTQYERFEKKSTPAIAAKDLARWLYIASACRMWLREQKALRAASRRRKNTARRNRETVSQWDWTSTGAPVMR